MGREAGTQLRLRLVELLIDGLASYRLTRLVVSDTITAQPRAAFIKAAYKRSARREGVTVSKRIGQAVTTMRAEDWPDLVHAEGADAPKVATLVACQWCMGVWVGFGVMAARRWLPGWRHIARGLALAAASSLAFTHE